MFVPTVDHPRSATQLSTHGLLWSAAGGTFVRAAQLGGIVLLRAAGHDFSNGNDTPAARALIGGVACLAGQLVLARPLELTMNAARRQIVHRFNRQVHAEWENAGAIPQEARDDLKAAVADAPKTLFSRLECVAGISWALSGVAVGLAGATYASEDPALVGITAGITLGAGILLEGASWGLEHLWHWYEGYRPNPNPPAGFDHRRHYREAVNTHVDTLLASAPNERSALAATLNGHFDICHAALHSGYGLLNGAAAGASVIGAGVALLLRAHTDPKGEAHYILASWTPAVPSLYIAATSLLELSKNTAAWSRTASSVDELKQQIRAPALPPEIVVVPAEPICPGGSDPEPSTKTVQLPQSHDTPVQNRPSA